MNRIKILVVEDDYLVSGKIVRALKEKNYEVIGLAYNGKEGVEKCCSLKPDLVLMDLKMPKMGGLEATKEIQKLCPTPVIILTAHETKELVDQASEVGVSSYLVKPFKKGEIERAIIIALARQKDLQKLRILTEQLQKEVKTRIESEKKLKESEIRFRDLFENMNNGVAVYEAINDGNDFIFTDFNKAGEKIEKISRDKLIGKSLLEVFPGVKKFGLFDVLKRVWETGESEHFPIAVYKDDRIQGWRENYVYKLPSGEIVAVYEDITDRKKAEEALKKNEEKFRIMIEKSSYSFAIKQEGKIVYTNKALYNLLGYSDNEIIGSNQGELMTEESRLLYMEKINELGKDEESQLTFEAILLKKDKTKINVEIFITNIIYNGKFARLVQIRDITKQKELLEILKKGAEQTKGLKGFIPICANCSLIRDDEKEGHPWVKPADYITERLPGVKFSHTICPNCARKLYPGINLNFDE